MEGKRESKWKKVWIKKGKSEGERNSLVFKTDLSGREMPAPLLGS